MIKNIILYTLASIGLLYTIAVGYNLVFPEIEQEWSAVKMIDEPCKDKMPCVSLTWGKWTLDGKESIGKELMCRNRECSWSLLVTPEISHLGFSFKYALLVALHLGLRALPPNL